MQYSFLYQRIADCILLRNADSVVHSESDNQDYFVKPYQTTEDFSTFLDYLLRQHRGDESDASVVKYAQSRKRILFPNKWPKKR